MCVARVLNVLDFSSHIYFPFSSSLNLTDPFPFLDFRVPKTGISSSATSPLCIDEHFGQCSTFDLFLVNSLYTRYSEGDQTKIEKIPQLLHSFFENVGKALRKGGGCDGSGSG